MINRMLGVLGGNEDLPIERLALSEDQATLSSVSHENCLKLWDLTHLKDSGSDEEELEDRTNADNAEATQQVCALTGCPKFCQTCTCELSKGCSENN